jgi:hypothetical protein
VPLGGKWRPLVGKVREWYVESWHLQGRSPRLCRLRTDGLDPRASIEHIDHILVYGPSKPCTLSSTEAWLKHTASLADLGEKLGMDPQIGQPTCRGLCREPFFSGAVGSVQICQRLAKGCYTWTM